MSKPSDLIIAAALAVDALDEAGNPRTHIQFLPMGEIKLRDGRGPFYLRDKAHAARVIEATQAFAGRMDQMIDYDHQSVFGAKDGVGGRAPAAGWSTPSNLVVKDDGIWGDVEWTAAADAALRAREYRYISPLFAVAANGDVTRLLNAGLTNTPAIDNLVPVAATTEQGADMALKDIALALGLSETATEAEITAAIAKEKVTAASVGAIATALGQPADATQEQLVAAATAAKAAGNPDPTQWAPMSLVTDLQGQVTALTTGAAEEKANASVAAAMKAGKVSPGQKDWATDYAKKDLAGFEKFVAAAAVIVEPGAEDRPEKPAAATTLTPEEKSVAASLNLTDEQYLAAKNADL